MILKVFGVFVLPSVMVSLGGFVGIYSALWELRLQKLLASCSGFS